VTTEERLKKLEKELAEGRRLTGWMLGALGLSLGAWVAIGAFKPGTARAQPARAALKEVRANRFIVMNDKGEATAMLFASDDTVGLSITSQKDKIRALFGIGKDGCGVYLYDEKGEARARLAVDKHGWRRPLAGGAAV